MLTIKTNIYVILIVFFQGEVVKKKKTSFNLCQYLEELVAQSGDVFWIRNIDYSEQLYINPAYEKIWGESCEILYSNPDPERWIQNIYSEDRKRLLKDFENRNPEVIPGQKFFQSYRITRPDGEVRWIEDESFAIFDKKGNHIGFAGIAKDITEKKNRELFLEKVLDEAKAASKAKTEFIENISHDIKTPISNLIGIADFLASNIKDEKLKDSAAALQKSAGQLLDFTNEILNIIEVDGGVDGGQLENIEFNIKDVASGVLDFLMPSIHEKELKLDFHTSKKIVSLVYSNRSHIYKIILNLISNAIKFTNMGGKISLRLLLTKEQEAFQVIEIRVKDTGIGFPEESKKIIFERYTRLTPAFEGKYTGSGIGLYLVKKFVDQLNGHIIVKSKIGMGSTFSVFLPVLKVVEEIKENLSEKKHQKQVEKQFNLQQAKVLLVEDNLIAQQVAEHLLTAEVSKVDIASSGEEAVKKFKSGNYNLILMDIGLPDISGYQVTENIRNYERENKKKRSFIIALTAHVRKKDLVQCKEAGMDEALFKPLNIQDLKNLLSKITNFSKDQLNDNQNLNKDINDLPVIDLTLGASIVEGDKEKAKNMIAKLVAMLPNDLEKIKMAFLGNNLEQVKELAHYIKGGASFCGTPRLKAAANALEKVIEKNKSKTEIAKIYHNLCIEMQSVCDEYAKIPKE